MQDAQQQCQLCHGCLFFLLFASKRSGKRKKRKEKNINSKPRGEKENLACDLASCRLSGSWTALFPENTRIFQGRSERADVWGRFREVPLLDGGFENGVFCHPASWQAHFFRSTEEARWQRATVSKARSRYQRRYCTPHVLASRNLCFTLGSSGT